MTMMMEFGRATTASLINIHPVTVPKGSGRATVGCTKLKFCLKLGNYACMKVMQEIEATSTAEAITCVKIKVSGTEIAAFNNEL
jgi:hypothetical protein